MFANLFYKRITPNQKIWFFQQFLKLNKIGFNILESLHCIQQAITHQTLHTIIFQLKKQLQSGLSFSESARQHPKLFDALCCQLIFIGEESGQLPSVLHHFITCQQHWLQLQAEIKKALRYPLFLLITAALVCWGVFTYIIPEFKLLFAAHLDALPAMTRCLFNFSDVISAHQTAILSILIFLTGFFLLLRKKIAFLYQCYSWSIPVLKTFHSQLFEMQFSNHLHLLLSSGIPLSESIHLIKQHNTHPLEKKILSALNYSLNEGTEFAQAIASSPYLSPLFKQSLQANPYGTTLIESLQELSTQLQQQFFEQMAKYKDGFEPLIMLVVGALIGIIILAIYMPIFKLGAVLT